jgi:hypothetical protein
MRRPQNERHRRVLAAVDPDPTDERRDALNEDVIDLAASLARLEERELYIVHAWTPFGGSILTGPLAELPRAERRAA